MLETQLKNGQNFTAFKGPGMVEFKYFSKHSRLALIALGASEGVLHLPPAEWQRQKNGQFNIKYQVPLVKVAI